MNRYIRLFVAAVLAVMTISPAFADEAQKLKDLESAMTAPGVDAPAPRKGRTRAIVFDDETQPAAAPASPVASTNGNCGELPTDVKAIAIDFSIQFKMGSAQISPASEKILREIAKVLSLSSRCVLVEGHTDATGNVDRNNALSRERADSVVNYIVEQSSIDRKRLVPIGKGSSEPLKNLNPRNPDNRRVVFKVVG
ncbi:MAG: OmpA family protein [Gallionella sp.]|jgi:outer membrane protein OmpA-like peptidoglycan-associated protein